MKSSDADADAMRRRCNSVVNRTPNFRSSCERSAASSAACRCTCQSGQSREAESDTTLRRDRAAPRRQLAAPESMCTRTGTEGDRTAARFSFTFPRRKVRMAARSEDRRLWRLFHAVVGSRCEWSCVLVSVESTSWWALCDGRAPLSRDCSQASRRSRRVQNSKRMHYLLLEDAPAHDVCSPSLPADCSNLTISRRK